MNYVVVDFEWNQNPYRKVPANRRMPFEIIEIGAVMLDENLKEIDRFSQTVRPKLYKKLHYKTKEITGITQRELDRSDPFKFVAVDFMNVDPTLWENWEAHPAFLSNDVLIVENLNNTLELEPGKRYLFDFAPIRLLGSDGGPVRAVAMDKEEPDVRA